MRTISGIVLFFCCVISFPAMAQWNITGNSNTTPGTNFLGTTNNVGLMFKANGVNSGYIDIVNTNTSFGYNALGSNSGQNNTAFGTGAAALNTTGSNNFAIGTYALVNNATSSYNMAIGRQALGNLTGGQMNTGVG